MESIDLVLKWLTLHDASGFSKDEVQFNFDLSKGVSCIAAKNYNEGDIIFSIPRKCLIGLKVASSNASLLGFVRKVAKAADIDQSILTSEFAIFLYMIEQLYQQSSFHHAYFQSLSTSNIPNIMAWPEELQNCFVGTNICDNISKADTNLESKLIFLKDIIRFVDLNIGEMKWKGEPSYIQHLEVLRAINKRTLLWAWSHYLSRRYPGHFSDDTCFTSATSTSATSVASSTTTALAATGMNSDELSTTYREDGFGNIGTLVPLLDILNHNTDHDWLRFALDPEMLHVVCNYPVAQVRTC